MTEPDVKALAKLREPFPANQIGKLPKGGMQLDFVGHGFITQRLLDVDPQWDWQPAALGENGLPLFDEFGGLWIVLTVCGVSRLGYGDAGGKKGPDATKIAIGDALRNAGMRFGLALDLWCKGDPDAPAPKRPQTPEDDARTALLLACKANKVDPATIGARFHKDTGLSIYEADAATIEAFTETITAQKLRVVKPDASK
jgi:hypothetical protein